ncbi:MULTISPECIES: hypothetical protein [unclassified Paenibacillus]|nr:MULTISPECIES: hypothetical protein [unclassified Paenibacillus]
MLRMVAGLVVGFVLTYMWGYQTRMKSEELTTQGTKDSAALSGIEELW